MAVTELVSEETYLRLARRDPDGRWELHRGQLVEKPGMNWERSDVITEFGFELRRQLDRDAYRVRFGTARVRHPAGSYYLPDVAVVPIAYEGQWRGASSLEVYDGALLLIAEVWSPSTGAFDAGEKLRDYQARGDEEIWRLQPKERTLIAWRRQPDGTYAETTSREGTVRPASLPGVEIDLASLFE